MTLQAADGGRKSILMELWASARLLVVPFIFLKFMP